MNAAEKEPFISGHVLAVIICSVSMAVPVLAFQLMGYLFSTFFFILAVVLIWYLPNDRYKLLAVIIWGICMIAYGPYLYYSLLFIYAILFDGGLQN